MQQSYIYLLVRHRLDGTSWATLARFDGTNAHCGRCSHRSCSAACDGFPFEGRTHAARPGDRRRRAHPRARRIAAGAHAPVRTALVLDLLLNLFVDLGIFGVLVAIGHRGALADWLRQREADTSTLEHELAVARDRSDELRRIPPILLRSLDGIAATVRQDPG